MCLQLTKIILLTMTRGKRFRRISEQAIVSKLLISFKGKSSPFCASFVLITWYARQGVFVYISSFEYMEFLSHLFSTIAVGIDQFSL